MEVLIFIGFIAFVLLSGKKLPFKFGLPPKTIEINQIKGLKKLNDDLEKSLSESYMKNVEERVKKENKLKKMSTSGVYVI